MPNWHLIFFSHSHKHKSNCKGGLQCFLIRVKIYKFKSFAPFSRRFHLSSLDHKWLWSVCMRQNQSDFHQFSWSPAFSDIIFITEFKVLKPMADFLFLTLKSWSFNSSCNQQTMLTFTSIHFGKSPHHKGKKPIWLFSLVKNFIYDFWLVRCLCLTCKENHPTFQNLGTLLQIIFFFLFSSEY